jgi:phosphoenolpyruvate synthase/pyruvate phosphate dikinase
VVQDQEYRRDLLARVLKAGHEIELALGSAQDVEGVIDESGEITVVQTRPQM